MEQDSEITREAIFEAIKNQIKSNDPPITKKTYDRLRTEGHTDEETTKLIGCALSVEIFEIIKNSEPFNVKRYTSNLEALPEMPWEE